jgi:hypothetical protein
MMSHKNRVNDVHRTAGVRFVMDRLPVPWAFTRTQRKRRPAIAHTGGQLGGSGGR